MIGLSVFMLGLSVYWLIKNNKTNTDKDTNKENALLFIICALVVIPWSSIRLGQISKTERWVKQWQNYVESAYKYTGGNYVVDNPPADGPSQMEVARKSFAVGDYQTAKEYAEKALGNGICEAATLIMDMYIYGLGVEPDLHQVVNYLLDGMEISVVDEYGEVLEMLDQKDYAFTERERMLLEKNLQNQEYLISVKDEIVAASEIPGIANSRKAIRNVLKQHHARMEELSSSGFVFATIFLYMECIEDQWQGGFQSEEDHNLLWKYCDIILSADCLPTDPYSRAQAFEIHDGPIDYKASNVDYFIKNNVFPELYKYYDQKVRMDKDFFLNDLDDDNEYLFAKYRLYRKQYEYAKSIVNEERWRNQLLCYQSEYPYSPELDCEWARVLIVEVINEIIHSMPTLENVSNRSGVEN